MTLARTTSPLFISFEGADGAGKSTQAALLSERLKASGVRVLSVREPGGTPVGEVLRNALKSGGDISSRTELLLFEAARAELVEKVIGPALAGGGVVIADRFADSSVAYQAHGRGLRTADVARLNRFATGGLVPDITFLLDLPVERASERAAGRDQGPGSSRRRFEAEPATFHRKVISGYRRMARAAPERWVTIDATRPTDQVADEIWAHVRRRLSLD